MWLSHNNNNKKLTICYLLIVYIPGHLYAYVKYGRHDLSLKADLKATMWLRESHADPNLRFSLLITWRNRIFSAQNNEESIRVHSAGVGGWVWKVNGAEGEIESERWAKERWKATGTPNRPPLADKFHADRQTIYDTKSTRACVCSSPQQPSSKEHKKRTMNK